jgi:hypothetical protein
VLRLTQPIKVPKSHRSMKIAFFSRFEVAKKTFVKLISITALFCAFLLGQIMSRKSHQVTFVAAARQTATTLDMEWLNGTLGSLYSREAIPTEVPPPDPDSYAWLDSRQFLAIAHGLGPQLWAGANSPETFAEGRRRGFRIFEVDVALTSDGKLVCFHGTSEKQLSSLTEAQISQRGKASRHHPTRILAISKLGTAG